MNDLTTKESRDEFERIERFQSLQSGEYCTAREDIPEEDIPAGETLLILSIDWVDGAAHTITLRAHPRHYGRTKSKHQFRIKDFLDKFDHEPNASQIRAAEVKEVQSRVFALQQELVDVQASPEKMQRIVAEGLAAESAKKPGANPDNLPAVIPSDAPPPLNLGTALTRGINETSIRALTMQAEHHLAVVTIQKNWITSKSNEITRAISAMTPYFEEQGAAVLAQTEEMQRYVKKVVDGIESLQLYVGSEVHVEKVREGKSAPAGVPLSIMQSKLIMVEELSVYADVTPRTDIAALKLFLELLGTEQGLVDQIFPTERCVVCMASNRQDIRYSDSLTSLVRNIENKKVFLLVRDGENIHMVLSPVETHIGADRLFPTRDEVDRLFRGFDGSDITFDSLEYTSSLKSFERQALHYKRLLILLCGLDHRLKLFGDFYEGPQDFSFVSLDFQEAHFNFIRDDDASAMISGGEQIEGVINWFSRMNRYLASGSRVLGLWGEVIDENSAPGAHRIRAHYYGEPDVRIAYQDGKDVCVELPVSRFSDNTPTNVKVMPKRSSREHTFQLMPYLVLDAVEPEEIRHYIYDRKSRVDQLSYIRMFKQALSFIEAERAAEAPARAHLRASLIAGGVVPSEDAEGLVSHAVRLWRAANRGAALPTLDQGFDAPGWKALMEVMYLLAHAGRDQLHRVEEFAARIDLAPLRLVVTGKGQLVLYAAPKPAERDNRLTPHVWVHRIVLRLGKRAVTELYRKWDRLPSMSASEQTVKQFDAAADWLGSFSGFKSLEQKDQVLAKCEQGVEYLRDLIGNKESFSKLAARYAAVRQSCIHRTKRSSRVRSPVLTVPIGVTWGKKDGSRERLYVLALRAHHAETFIAAIAPSSEFREAFKLIFVQAFANKVSNAAEYDGYPSMSRVLSTLDLVLIPREEALKLDDIPLHHPDAIQYESAYYSNNSSRVPTLDKLVPEFIDYRPGRMSVWLAGGLSVTERTGLDRIFGIEVDIEKYKPGSIHQYSFFRGAMGNKSPYEVIYVALGEGEKSPRLDFANDYSVSGSSRQWLLPEEFTVIEAELNAEEGLIRGDDLPEGMPRLGYEGLGCWYKVYKPK
ncbi:hypothetical protein [Ectopseudomonas mendocina]|uniref:Uncharacterized protein n=1 Tax=Ectopseudomonas mendocina S5.2 TaxID=1225174 RepID=A0ABN4J1B5_ECTME|nr:hypothetical protein [Pseudomonas mendocina]ALN21780.1 hypothetical protein DW68_024185 [Pseudomonas mendocina S5.2]